MGKLAVAEEQPASALGLRRTALLHEGAERRDAGAGADHDDVLVRIGKREMSIGPELHPHPIAALEPLGNIIRGDAFARRPWVL